MNDCRYGVSPVNYPDPDPGQRIHGRQGHREYACCRLEQVQETVASSEKYRPPIFTKKTNRRHVNRDGPCRPSVCYRRGERKTRGTNIETDTTWVDLHRKAIFE